MNDTDTRGHTLLRLSGRDALGVIQRISSQQFEHLETGDARTTLFLDFRGRLLHRVTVARASDGALWLLRDDAPADTLRDHIDRHVFREVVTIEDRSAEWRPVARWRDEDTPMVEANGVPVHVPEGRGFRFDLAPPGPLDPDDVLARERERITRGRPRHGHEIHEDWNPYEIGCSDEVHLSKGCYTGQEALQRLITYASVKRQPVLVRGRGAAPEVPAALGGPDGDAGRLTSAVAGEKADEWLGIAIVRKSALAGSTGGTVPPFAAEGATIDTFAPFPERQPRGRDIG